MTARPKKSLKPKSRHRFLKSLAAAASSGPGLTLLRTPRAQAQAQAAPGEVTLSPTSSADNVVTAQAPSVRPLTLRGAAGQSAALQQWQDSSGTVLGSIDKRGRLKIVGDGAEGTTGTLILENRTAGATPAQAPTLILNKDGTSRWALGIDQTPGVQSDFNLYHFHSDPSQGRDVLFLTDEMYPKVSINCDRYSAAAFTVNNLVDRPTMHAGGAPGQTADMLQFKRHGDPSVVFAIGAVGTLRLANAAYVPRRSDAPHGAGFLTNAAGQLTWLSSDGSITTLGPDPAIDDGHNVSFGTLAGTKLGTSPSQKIGFFNSAPAARRVLTYPFASETPAETAIRQALVSLGLVAPSSVGV